MNRLSIIFPHQLFENSPLVKEANDIAVIEEFLFFKQFNFHKQKLAFHRASMKSYANSISNYKSLDYIDSISERSDIRNYLVVEQNNYDIIEIIDPVDDWLLRRIKSRVPTEKLIVHPSPSFLTDLNEYSDFFRKEKKKYFQTEFYIKQRKSLNILVDDDKPIGGKWSFDHENRKKYPRKKNPPKIYFPDENEFTCEAIEYVQKNFPNNYGNLDQFPLYPIDWRGSKLWLKDFLKERFEEFGPYEDAIVAKENFLNHSVLTPMLNTGLLLPMYIISEALDYAEKNEIPINSLEGFIRQIIGWREFIRGIYIAKGAEERNRNFWQFHRKIPNTFYTGDTGIIPIDQTIKKLLNTGYTHHIERLMILGNFMFLCEFDPDEVYKWFMELFIDAYDWVMVPNVYGMSQFADGGLMSTKPYFSGSNYIKKMSDYPNGEWQAIWDGLFWRFMNLHRNFFSSNARMRMLISSLDKMDEMKKNGHFSIAENFLKSLDGE